MGGLLIQVACNRGGGGGFTEISIARCLALQQCVLSASLNFGYSRSVGLCAVPNLINLSWPSMTMKDPVWDCQRPGLFLFWMEEKGPSKAARDTKA